MSHAEARLTAFMKTVRFTSLAAAFAKNFEAKAFIEHSLNTALASPANVEFLLSRFTVLKIRLHSFAKSFDFTLFVSL